MRLPTYPDYKDSGVRWLGKIPTSWDVKALKHAFSIVGGSTPKSDNEDFWDGDVVWVTPADLSGLNGLSIEDSGRRITALGLESCGTRLVPPGSVVLSIRAPIGSLAIAGSTLCTNQGCKSLVAKSPISSRFFAYMLSVASEELNLRGRGTTFLELSGDALGSFEIAFPSLPEQSAIAAFLDRETAKIDALIAEQVRLLELLTEKRQAVISHAVTKGLNPDAPMKDSGVAWLGEVPAHWDVMRLATLYREVNEPGSDDRPTLSVSIHDGVSDDEIDEADSERKVTRSEDKGKYKRVEPNDLTYNMMRAWQGAFGSVTVSGQVSPAYVVARPRTVFETRFIEALLRTPKAKEQIRRYSRGITDFRLRLYWDEFKELRVGVPPHNEQVEVLASIDQMNRQFDELQSAAKSMIKLLYERRSALIAAAVTGQIDVREAA